MNNIFNKAFLSGGKNLKLSNNVEVIHPTVKDIYELGDGFNCEQIYWEYVNIILCDPYTNMVELDDMGLNYLELKPFDLLVIKWKRLIEAYNEKKEVFDSFNYNPLNQIKDSLIFFLGNHDFELIFIIEEDSYFIVDNNSKNSDGVFEYYISGENFNIISEFISVINCIDDSYKINPADDSARSILIQDAREENERLKINKPTAKEYDYLGTSIDVLCCGEGSINYLNVNQYKIYQLLKSVRGKTKRIHYDHVMQGIYAGTVDSSKVNKEELTWID